MNVTEAEAKEDTKRCCGNGCRQRDSAEHEEYDGASIEPKITENNTINPQTDGLLERILNPANLNKAYKQVKRNKGAGGIDGMSTDELLCYLREHREEIRQSILTGKYRPSPVRRVEIPKGNGKMRMLGIPTAVDRVIQQAIAQILTPIYEPEFVETSYGFRPGRSAQQAILKTLEYLNEGYVWAVDMDLEKFFDTVNQSKLIEILSRKIKDGRVISLIHRYLRAGAIWCGRFEETEVGVCQGGPLSPLCANIILNELDHELERRGHKFVRYADDMLILCRSKASAKQTLEHIIPYIERKLFLKVNREKTVVAYAGSVKFLGYGFYKAKEGFRPTVHKKSKEKLKAKVRELTQRRNVISYDGWKQRLAWLIRGWVNYYKLADMRGWLEEIDGWMRRRIRMVIWKKWKRVRTRWKNLEKLGINHEEAGQMACSRKGYWRLSETPAIHRAISNDRLRKAGYMFFSEYYASARGVN